MANQHFKIARLRHNKIVEYISGDLEYIYLDYCRAINDASARDSKFKGAKPTNFDELLYLLNKAQENAEKRYPANVTFVDYVKWDLEN
jgi:hypothetical protein